MSSSILPTPTGIVRLRPKNQLTIPDSAVVAVGATVGARFVVSVDEGAIRLQPVLQSYAGALRDVWPADWAQQLRKDRDSWGG